MARYYAGLRMQEYFMLSIVSFAVGIGLSVAYPHYPDWLYIGLIFSTFVLGHMCLTASRFMILPELLVFNACVYWILGAAFSYIYPPTFWMFKMSISAQEYFSYSVPATMALWLGVHLPLRKRTVGATEKGEKEPLSRRDRVFMDALILFGFLMTVLSGHLPYQLSFLYHILESLRFVGAMAFLLTNTRGWVVRIFVVYFSLLIQTAAGGIFYELVLWLGYLFVVLAYKRRWQWWHLLVSITLMLFFISHFNIAKLQYRIELNARTMTPTQRLSVLGHLYWNQLTGKAAAPTEFGDKLVRWNQGWIIARVLSTVPEKEPFAGGHTIGEAVVASFVPRVFMPDKISAGSQEFFRKYTDLQLPVGTAMALSTIGEMYVNFGRAGGILATMLYGLFIGMIFALFVRLARHNFLWWAWAPVVVLTTLEAEWNLVDVLNNISKSALVVVVIIYFFEPFRNRLWIKKRTSA